MSASVGFLTGLGAVAANVIYASTASFSYFILSGLLLGYHLYLKIVLIHLGVKKPINGNVLIYFSPIMSPS